MAVGARDLKLKLIRRADDVEVELDPLQGLWTEAQYLRLTDQVNHLIEFTDGAIEILPMPTRKHQVILALLYELLVGLLRPRGGKVLFAPLRVQIAPHRFREPDLVALLDAGDPRNQDAFWLGADLVVEIVSPANPARDTVEKPADYAAAGILEYWIVNPVNETITVLTLQDDTYVTHGTFRRGEAAASPLLDGFRVDVNLVFDAE
jgi:Uma2 family endonuclease